MFDTILIVDWSARAKPSPSRPSADALWVGTMRDGVGEEARYFRTRAGLMAWLGETLVAERGRRVLVGFDFPFGYPEGFAAALTGRAEALAVWRHLGGLIEDGPDNANNRFEVAAAINAGLPGVGPFWGRPAHRRLDALPDRGSVRQGHGFAEHRRVERLVPGAQSVWKLYTTGSVGGQTLTGLPALHRLRLDPRISERVAVWPFETGFSAPTASIVLAEIYPSLLGRLVSAEVKDAAQVTALARALARLDAAGRLAPLFAPEGEARAVVEREEGWILGVGFEQALRAAHAGSVQRSADTP